MNDSLRASSVKPMATGRSPIQLVHGGELARGAELAARSTILGAKRARVATAQPAIVGSMRLPEATSGADYCSVLFAFHADAVSRNLECVFSSINPEGPHQLRVALRRLRVVLRAFEPVIRQSVAAEFQAEARAIGSIISELRDADVMIDEIIAPAARQQPELVAALSAWRQEVRGRVRARLLAVDASGFAARLRGAASAIDWRKKSVKAQGTPALEHISAFLTRGWAEVAPAIASLHIRAPSQIHDLRKAVKAVRYAADFGGGLSHDGHAEMAVALKRVQDALGYVNDLDTLMRFAPALVAEGEAVSLLSQRLATERADAARQRLATAQAELQSIARTYGLETAQS
jgi:triphosphatase